MRFHCSTVSLCTISLNWIKLCINYFEKLKPNWKFNFVENNWRFEHVAEWLNVEVANERGTERENYSFDILRL